MWIPDLPTDGTPLKGYELARADIEKRGDGSEESLSKSKPGLFASLFKRGKSNDEEDEGAAAPAVSEKPAPVTVAAAAPAKSSEAKSSEAVPMPRAKPGSTLQLASADMQIVQAGRSKPAVMRRRVCSPGLLSPRVGPSVRSRVSNRMVPPNRM